MDQRAAKKYATEHLAEAARMTANLFADPQGGALEGYPPRDRARMARAYGELADELDRRYNPRPKADAVASDPDQLPLFPEGQWPPLPAHTAEKPTSGSV